jgi:hypothetical protein
MGPILAVANFTLFFSSVSGYGRDSSIFFLLVEDITVVHAW